MAGVIATVDALDGSNGCTARTNCSDSGERRGGIGGRGMRTCAGGLAGASATWVLDSETEESAGSSASVGATTTSDDALKTLSTGSGATLGVSGGLLGAGAAMRASGTCGSGVIGTAGAICTTGGADWTGGLDCTGGVDGMGAMVTTLGATGCGFIAGGGALCRSAARCPCPGGRLPAAMIATLMSAAPMVPAMVGVSRGVGRNLGPSAEMAAKSDATMNRPRPVVASTAVLSPIPANKARNTKHIATLTTSARDTIMARINSPQTRYTENGATSSPVHITAWAQFAISLNYLPIGL